MYNILLTDDEQIMIDSLRFIISKYFPSDVRVNESLSGSEALEIVAKNDIDIIFMDINMPGLNGLETVRYITQSKPETVVIILSAYDQFKYAQEAVSLGVYRYLTKPVNRNIVVETLRGAMAEVDKKRGRKSSEQELHKKLDIVSPMVESDFIYSAAFSGAKDVSEYFRYFDIESSLWCFCCLEIPHLDAGQQYIVYNKIRKTLTTRVRCILGSFMLNRIVVFFTFPLNADRETVEENAVDTITTLYRQLCINITSGIRAGVSLFETEQDKTGKAYNDAIETLNLCANNGDLKFAQRTRDKKHTKQNPGTLAEKIFARVRAGDSASLPSLINAYREALEQKYESDTGKIKNAFFELLVNIRNITTEIDTSYENDEFASSFSFLTGENNMDKIEAFVQARCTECALDVLQVSQRQGNPIIEKAQEYIKEHIAENLSLDDTAQAVNVSSFYLSKLFKEERGENYITFITDMRMQKARELLRNPRASIKEVSISVGYNDQNYFSRIFRSKFGMTPTEFRDAAKD